jgi:hypothetical protein
VASRFKKDTGIYEVLALSSLRRGFDRTSMVMTVLKIGRIMHWNWRNGIEKSF